MEKHTLQQRQDINRENRKRHTDKLARKSDCERMRRQQLMREEAKEKLRQENKKKSKRR